MIGFLAFISEQVDEICTSFERYLVLVARKEAIYTYRYSDEKIDCTITVTSYLADGTVASTDVRESERLR